MITYQTSVDGIDPKDLQGFFVGWPTAPSPETHLALLRNSSVVVVRWTISLGAGSTKLYIIEGGIVRSSHSINRGSQDITTALSTSFGISLSEAENIKRGFGNTHPGNEKEIYDVMSLTMEFIFSETNRTILNYQQKYGKNIDKVILTGGGVGYKGLLDIAKLNLQTQVELGDPFKKVEYPAFMEEVLRQTGPEFSVAIGVALRRLREI